MVEFGINPEFRKVLSFILKSQERLCARTRLIILQVCRGVLSGCRAEDARLRSAERLVKLIAVFCILAWRVFWTTMVGRAAPGADPRLAVTAAEIALLDRLVPDRAAGGRTLSAYVVKVARLGGYLARSRDPPPGNLVMWRGFARLADIALGATFARASPGCG